MWLAEGVDSRGWRYPNVYGLPEGVTSLKVLLAEGVTSLNVLLAEGVMSLKVLLAEGAVPFSCDCRIRNIPIFFLGGGGIDRCRFNIV